MNDSRERRLMYHPENDVLFEVFSQSQLEMAMFISEGTAIDMTNDEAAEDRFKTEKVLKQWASSLTN